MSMPDWLEPMAATLTEERFVGPDWLFERKFDGIRLVAYKRADDVQLFSRNRLPQTMPAIAGAIKALPARELILDGEVTWDGRSGYHVFDVLWLDGELVTSLPLEHRRSLLQALPLAAPLRRVELVDDAAPWDLAKREGWEGVIAKRRGSPYEHRRSKLWLKMKCEFSQELVVGGFTDPQGARVGLGALLVGYYEGGDFVFAGKIGTGFDTKLLIDLRGRLDGLEIPASPFTKAKGLPRLRVHWVRPAVVVQVAFIEWTVHDKLRHPRLIGVRFDKDPGDVVREHRDHASRQGALSGGRNHEGRVGGLLRRDCASDVAASSGAAGHDGALPCRDRAQGFWQKNVSKGFPPWLKRIAVQKKGGVVNHPLVSDRRSLEWVTNQNTITQHVWCSRSPRLTFPDLCVFDLDPSTSDIAAVRLAALELRDLLAELGLPSWIKTSGSKGFHIVVSIDGKTPTGVVARFANAVGELMVRRAPDRLTQEFSKADRGGRIYIDTGRNGYSATFAAAYTVRAKDGAPVSAPCTWEEIEREAVTPTTFTLRNMATRIDEVGDLWSDLRRPGRSLRRAIERLKSVSAG